MRRRIVSIFGILILVSLAGFLVFDIAGSSPEAVLQAGEGASSEETVPAPIQVEVTPATRQPLRRNLEMPGTLLAGEVAGLFAKISGYLSEIRVDIGSRVQAGDVLLEILAPEMADELAQAQALVAAKAAKLKALDAQSLQAEAMVEIARAEVFGAQAKYHLQEITLGRKEKLIQEGAITLQDFDEAQSQSAIAQAQVRIAEFKVAGAESAMAVARADVEVARADVDVAQANVGRLKTLMSYATVRAPFDGVITERHVDPGAFVRSAAEGETKPLLTLAVTDRLRLSLEIPESDVASVQVGTPVSILVKAVGIDPLEAQITRTAVALKSRTRTMRCEVDLDNQAGRLAPGMYAQVTVQLEAKESALLIPSKSIHVRGRELSLLVAREGVAWFVPITIGYDDGIWAEVVEGGLQESDLVIIAAKTAVAPGAAVQPVTPTLSAAN